MNSGRIMRDEEHEENKKKNGNGNNSNGNGSGNGDSNGSSDGGGVAEGWSAKYKKSIDCNNPKGFSQRAHCQGRKKMNEAKSGDHEIGMAQSQLKNSAENIAKLRKKLGKKERDIPAWMQAKITDTEHNTDAAASYVDNISEARDGKSAKDKGYSLRDWFKGGGWVQTGGKYDGKPCAKQPGQKTKPFCRDADDRAAMSKDEREKRARKKRQEDPNPNRKGKAKMVTETHSNWRVELERQLIEDNKVKTRGGANDRIDIEFPGGGKQTIIPGKTKITGPGAVIRPTGATRYNFGVDKTGLKGPEKPLGEEKDACYRKVKSRYSVWPSAYASGALVKCRKVGAKNWGNKTKNEGYEFSNWRDDFKPTEYEFVDLIKPEPMKGLSEAKLGKCEKNKIEKYIKGMKKSKGSFNDNYGSDSKSVMYATATNMAKKACKEDLSDWRTELVEAKINKSKMKCNKPKAQAVGDSLTGKSHVVKACEGGKEKIIRFGQRGVKGSPKKKGESKEYASRRHRFQTRHAKNIAKGKMSAAYWANKVKW